jgi:hypothetical protein
MPCTCRLDADVVGAYRVVCPRHILRAIAIMSALVALVAVPVALACHVVATHLPQLPR